MFEVEGLRSRRGPNQGRPGSRDAAGRRVRERAGRRSQEANLRSDPIQLRAGAELNGFWWPGLWRGEGCARTCRRVLITSRGVDMEAATTPAADEPRSASNPMQNRPIHSPRTNQKYRPEQTSNTAGGQRVPYKTAPRRICVGVRGWGPERQARPREEDARLSSGSNSRTVRNPSRSSACGARICRGYLRGLWPRRCRGTLRWRRTRGP